MELIRISAPADTLVSAVDMQCLPFLLGELAVQESTLVSMGIVVSIEAAKSYCQPLDLMEFASMELRSISADTIVSTADVQCLPFLLGELTVQESTLVSMGIVVSIEAVKSYRREALVVVEIA